MTFLTCSTFHFKPYCHGWHYTNPSRSYTPPIFYWLNMLPKAVSSLTYRAPAVKFWNIFLSIFPALIAFFTAFLSFFLLKSYKLIGKPKITPHTWGIQPLKFNAKLKHWSRKTIVTLPQTNYYLINYYTIGKINYESSQTQNSVTLSAVYRADRLNFNSAAVVWLRSCH